MSVHNRIDRYETLSWLNGEDEAEISDSLSDTSTEPTTDEPSETSDDRAFVASDAESSTYSSEISDPFDLHQAPSVIHDERHPDEVGPQIGLSELKLTELKVGLKWPVKTIAKRHVDDNDNCVVQYLVLWCSWETSMPLTSGE